MKTFARTIALASMCAACGSNTNSASGSVNGQSFKPADAVFATETESEGDSSATEIVMLMSAFGGACAWANDPNTPTSQSVPGAILQISVAAMNANSIATTATHIQTEADAEATLNTAFQGGTTAQVAVAYFVDPNRVESTATSGTVTVNSVSGTHFDGTYDAVFPSGTLSGSFSASFCDIDLSSTDS